MLLDGIYLTLMMGPTIPVPVPQVVLDALTSVQVTSSAGQRSGFQLSFAIDSKSPLQTILLLMGGQLAPLLRVVLVATLNGTPNVLMDGVVTRHSLAPGSQPGQSVLTLTGEDVSAAMDLVDMTGLPYPGMSMEVRILTILAKYALYGLIPGIIPALFSDTPTPNERYPIHKGTDLAYITSLAREVGYIFYIEPGPLPGSNLAYWGPEIKIGLPQPALNIDMDAHTNVEDLTFDFDGTKSSATIIYIQEQDSKLTIPIPIPDVSLLQPPLGLVQPLPMTVRQLRETAKLKPMEAIGRGLAETSRSSDVVTGHGSLDVLRYGRILKSRQIVGVRGAGLSFDGLYYINRVTSTISRGEFKQNFDLSRNGLVSITPVVPV